MFCGAPAVVRLFWCKWIILKPTLYLILHIKVHILWYMYLTITFISTSILWLMFCNASKFLLAFPFLYFEEVQLNERQRNACIFFVSMLWTMKQRHDKPAPSQYSRTLHHNATLISQASLWGQNYTLYHLYWSRREYNTCETYKLVVLWFNDTANFSEDKMIGKVHYTAEGHATRDNSSISR